MTEDEIGRLDVEIHASIKEQAKTNTMIKQEMEALQQSTLETVNKVASVLEKCKIIMQPKKAVR